MVCARVTHMALDELHARRLATVLSVFDGALERMDQVLKRLKTGRLGEPSDFKPEQIRRAREKLTILRTRLAELATRFSIQVRKASPKQELMAELSRLWVVLEDARTERMKGYGREFSPEDKADWDKMIEGLISDVMEIRREFVKKSSKT